MLMLMRVLILLRVLVVVLLRVLACCTRLCHPPKSCSRLQWQLAIEFAR
jgi:hypothetical protein